MKRCQLCGTYRQPKQLKQFTKLGTMEQIFACADKVVCERRMKTRTPLGEWLKKKKADPRVKEILRTLQNPDPYGIRNPPIV